MYLNDDLLHEESCSVLQTGAGKITTQTFGINFCEVIQQSLTQKVENSQICLAWGRPKRVRQERRKDRGEKRK